MMTLWKSIIQSKLEHNSQLWSPADQASINSLEDVARHYTAKIDGMEGKSYPERLEALGMFSQERRRERNIIVFLWKVSQGLVKGYKASFNYNERRGNLMILAPLKNSAPATVKKAREASLQVRGAKLFNLIPKELRDGFISVDKFKADLDDWLKSIPDEPTSAGRQRAAESNSLLHQVVYRKDDSLN